MSTAASYPEEYPTTYHTEIGVASVAGHIFDRQEQEHSDGIIPCAGPTDELDVNYLGSDLGLENSSQAVSNNRLTNASQWVAKHTFGIGIALSSAGLAYSLTRNPYSEVIDGIEGNLPLAGALTAVGAAGEIAYVAGAAIALKGAGKYISPKQWFGSSNNINQLGEVGTNVNERLIKRGLAVNFLGAIATPAAVVVGAGVMLPREAFLGVAVAAGVDVASTVVSRGMLVHGINRKLHRDGHLARAVPGERKRDALVTREATTADIAGIVELDLKMYPKDGERVRSAEEVDEMMQHRFENVNEQQGGKMFVQQRDGKIVSFITAFRTNKPAEEFVSWEESTGDGTLNGKVEPDGEYVYIANLTVDDEGNKDILMGALLGWGIETGIEYGYFEARMPGFKGWASEHLTGQGKTWEDLDESERDNLAEYYRYLEREDGKPSDWQVRMYQSIPGFSVGPARKNAFNDEESLNYGIMCKAHTPLWDKPKTLRRAAVGALRFALRFPKLLERVF